MDLTNYLAWMKDVESYPFIEGTNSEYTLTQLQDYINGVNSSPNSIMLSIFTKTNEHHIGNLKFHDINFTLNSCWVGFLIGDKSWQHKGVARESFLTSAHQLCRDLALKTFRLGVHLDNSDAITSYSKMGFKEITRLALRLEMLFSVDS